MEVLEQKYNEAMEKPLRVLEIFNDFFDESRVDMQGFPTLAEIESILPVTASVAQIKEAIEQRLRALNRQGGFILVHFPHVTVTNEYDRHTEINHLYAKVEFDINGKIIGRFLLNRSEYSVLHFINGYMHSHISSIPLYNFKQFQQPCTGSGPINNTICSLAVDFDEDLWRLFCLELDRYVQVESIAGTPYHRLEELSPSGRRSRDIMSHREVRLRTVPPHFDGITPAQEAEFIKYVIDSEVLRFSYQFGGYHLAMSATEYYIKISNLFIKWYNREYKAGRIHYDLQELLRTGIINNLKFINGGLYKTSGNNRFNYNTYIGAKICTFKGEDVLLTISDAQESTAQDNTVTVISQEFGDYIFTKIFNVINLRYGNSKHENTANKKVFFL